MTSARPSAPSTRPTPPVPALVRGLRALAGLPALLLLLAIRLYQRTLSPALPAIFGPACGCRFYPTCSHYAAEAVRQHGALLGAALALIRLVKCTPLHPGGEDPVPERVTFLRRRRPTCHRAGNPAPDALLSSPFRISPPSSQV